jgi:hypothetical protein
LNHSAANVERRTDHLVCAGPLHREHNADDVDDRVEGADFVQVDFLHWHLVNRCLGFTEALEHRPSRARGRTATTPSCRSA